MIRVSVAVPLQIADKPEHRLYLRNSSIIAMKHLEANVAATLSEKTYNFSNIGVATHNVPGQISVAEMGHYLVLGDT